MDLRGQRVVRFLVAVIENATRWSFSSKYAQPMKKSLRCMLLFHDWEWRRNDEGQPYKICRRCGKFQDFNPSMGAS